MYDLLIVGSGITAATLVAMLRGRMRICVVECRKHFGGNCADYVSDGTQIHRYGPHIFHSPSPRITQFLGRFTNWEPYEHRVTARVIDERRMAYVPFPYSGDTVTALGRRLSEGEIVEMFFKGYSQKMWGMPWQSLPQSIRRRVPKEPRVGVRYYRDQFSAMPQGGYSRMLENMLDGVEILLGAGPNEWERIPARKVVYTGRPDLIPVPGERVTIAEQEGLELPFRTLDIKFTVEEWPYSTACLHDCTEDEDWTRKTSFRRMTGGASNVVATEVPRAALPLDLSPFYPIELAQNRCRYQSLAERVRSLYPRLHLAGRLGLYRYFDMYQAVGHAIALGSRLCKS